VEVAFALDAAGNLLTWAGESPAFSPAGQFRAQESGEASHNLYLVVISERRYLGVLFEDGAGVEEIQDVMTEWQGILAVAAD
jgi:hypothetical protein